MLFILGFLEIALSATFFDRGTVNVEVPEGVLSNPSESQFGSEIVYSEEDDSLYISAPNAILKDEKLPTGQIFKCSFVSNTIVCQHKFNSVNPQARINSKPATSPRFGATMRNVKGSNRILICAPLNRGLISNGNDCYLIEKSTGQIVQIKQLPRDNQGLESTFGYFVEIYDARQETFTYLIGQRSYLNRESLKKISAANIEGIQLTDPYIQGILLVEFRDAKKELLIFHSKSNFGYGTIEIKNSDLQSKQTLLMTKGSPYQALGYSSSMCLPASGLPIVAVSAPFFSKNYYEGVVYLFNYNNERKLEMLNILLTGDQATESYFGIHVIFLEDLNRDGYFELAVLSQGEDPKTPIIYIYEIDIQLDVIEFSQRLIVLVQNPANLIFGAKMLFVFDRHANSIKRLALTLPAAANVITFVGKNSLKINIEADVNSVPSQFINSFASTFDGQTGFYFEYDCEIRLSIPNLNSGQDIDVKYSVEPEFPMRGYHIKDASQGIGAVEFNEPMGSTIKTKKIKIYQELTLKAATRMKFIFKAQLNPSQTQITLLPTNTVYNSDTVSKEFTFISKYESCQPNACFDSYDFSYNYETTFTEYWTTKIELTLNVESKYEDVPSALLVSQTYPQNVKIILKEVNSDQKFAKVSKDQATSNIKFSIYSFHSTSLKKLTAKLEIELNRDISSRLLVVPLEIQNPLYKGSLVSRHNVELDFEFPPLFDFKLKNEPDQLYLVAKTQESQQSRDLFLNYSIEIRNTDNQLTVSELTINIDIETFIDGKQLLTLLNSDSKLAASDSMCLKADKKLCGGHSIIYRYKNVKPAEVCSIIIKFRIDERFISEIDQMQQFAFAVSANWKAGEIIGTFQKTLATRAGIIRKLDLKSTGTWVAIIFGVIASLFVLGLVLFFVIRLNLMNRIKAAILKATPLSV